MPYGKGFAANLPEYRKALVAGLGVVVMVAPAVAGVDTDTLAVFDGVVGLLTAFGVFRVPNAAPLRLPPPPTPPPVSPVVTRHKYNKHRH